MAIINIDIISDVVCAWCFIAKRTLDRAIDLHQKTYPGGRNDTFNVRWRPYYLNYNRLVPDTGSVPKSEVRDIKLADWSEEKRVALTQRMNQIGLSNGIVFKWGGRVGGTRDAHLLIEASHVKTQEVQDALAEGLFRAFHELEEDITEREVLRLIALEAGMEGEEVDAALGSEGEAEKVDREALENRERVTSGVPAIIIQGVHRIDGAQDPQDFMEVFVKIRESEAA